MSINNKRILAELKDHLIKHYGDSVKDVVLFGSQARGDSNEFSDYDIYVEFEKKSSLKCSMK